MSDLKIDTTPADEPGIPSGSFTPPEYAVAPEDQHILDEILATDPLALPGPVSVKGDLPKGPERYTLAHLKGTALFAEVERRLASQPPGSRSADVEHELVERALRENSLDLRAAGGFGAGAPPVFREAAAISNEVRQLDREFDTLQAELARVSHHETGVDANGDPKAIPVPLISRERMRAVLARLDEILHVRALKCPGGYEFERRMAKARFDSVEQVKAQKAEAAKLAKIEARAAAMVEEEEIERLARSKARMRGAEVRDQ